MTPKICLPTYDRPLQSFSFPKKCLLLTEFSIKYSFLWTEASCTTYIRKQVITGTYVGQQQKFVKLFGYMNKAKTY